LCALRVVPRVFRAREIRVVVGMIGRNLPAHRVCLSSDPRSELRVLF
jgi:hypothetical protein